MVDLSRQGHSAGPVEYGPRPRSAVARGRDAARPARDSRETTRRRIHVAHVIYRLAIGGLENGLVNLINRLPAEKFRHTVICLTDYTDFRARIDRSDVEVVALRKRPGNDIRMLVRLWSLFRELGPDIVHTRNLAALEASVPAWLAGVPIRVHGEHGRDMEDLEGKSRKHRLIRRLCRPFVHSYVALSRDLEDYLSERVGVPERKIFQIYNGVDTRRFHPSQDVERPSMIEDLAGPEAVVFGTVGRLQPVKNQGCLVEAFIRLVSRDPERYGRARLVVVGDGPERGRAQERLAGAGLGHLAWFAGARDDVPVLMRAMDVFVLPSLAEGISNTVLEAMATGLPVVATGVGGNPELVHEGATGVLVEPGDPDALARGMARYLDEPGLAQVHGEAGRNRVLREFSLDTMLRRYERLYDGLTGPRGAKG